MLGEFQAIHRIFLSKDGAKKADPKKDSKRHKGSTKGASVQLGPPAEELSLCGGVEDGLSVQRLYDSESVWCVLGEDGFSTIKLPHIVRRLVIYADNDGPSHHMAEKASRVWMQRGYPVWVVYPKSHKDFNDLLQEQLPVEGFAVAEEAKPYPREALPPIVRGAVDAYQAYGQQPYSLVACSTLATCSLAVQGLVDVARDENLIGPTSLNIMVVGESGERKTAADRRMSKPVQNWMIQQKEELQPLADEANAKIAAWKAEKEGLLQTIKRYAGNAKKHTEFDEAKQQLVALDQHKPSDFYLPPVHRRRHTRGARFRHGKWLAFVVAVE